MAILLVLGSVTGVAALACLLEEQGRTPREWAPYLIRRAATHRLIVTESTAAIAALLEHLDRANRRPASALPSWTGAAINASPREDSALPLNRLRPVGSIQSLVIALRESEAGDIIELLPGKYRIAGGGLLINRAARPDAPITLRAARLGDVVLESAAEEAIKVNASDWHFENLIMRGLCTPQNDSDCEHAFHVAGNASRTVIRNNRLEDFNAQIKINAENGSFPDDGIIERNTLVNSRARMTSNPVTPIDLVAASGWRVRGNLVADFIKGDGDLVSYGAYAKGTGEKNAFEDNVVLCEYRLLGMPGQRVGISFGGGGTADMDRRDGGRSRLEQKNGTMSGNLIAFCSDAGIYINRSMNSRIAHNTLLDTSGITVRFPESSADITGNLIDGIISNRDNATTRLGLNQQASLLGLFIGLHPQRKLLVDVASLDLRWRGLPPRDETPASGIDLCGASRAARPALGAFENFTDCLENHH